MTSLIEIKKDINLKLGDKETFASLVSTTFKGLDVNIVKRAVMEGMMRGFKFEDFLEKNVYAIPFGNNGYSLVTSIDYARKIGQRSGVNGKSRPIFVEDDKGKIKSCAITVYKQGGHPDGYTAEVWFDEYSTGKNLWTTKPRTMIAKVAEMHALRMACPEELSQMYTEEEKQKEQPVVVELDLEPHKEKLTAAKDVDELKKVWAAIPGKAKVALKPLQEKLKKQYATA